MILRIQFYSTAPMQSEIHSYKANVSIVYLLRACVREVHKSSTTENPRSHLSCDSGGVCTRVALVIFRLLSRKIVNVCCYPSETPSL